MTNFTYVLDFFYVLTHPCNFSSVGEKDFQKEDRYAKQDVVQIRVGTVCVHTDFAGMEHVVNIDTGKGGNK